jgi:biotin operon repressor
LFGGTKARETIAEMMKTHSQSAIARQLGISRQRVHFIIHQNRTSVPVDGLVTVG